MEISDMQWYHWLIFIIPVVCLFVLAPLYLLWWGRKPKFPKGVRYTAKRGDFTVHLVVSAVVPGGHVFDKHLADKCATAVWSAGTTWRKIVREDTDEIRESCVYIQEEADFINSPFTEIQNAAAYLVYTGARVGGGIPMAVIRNRESYITQILRRGEPVIHEMMHALLGDYTEPDKDRDHSHPFVWAANEDDGVQAQARKLFLKTTE